MGDDVENQIGVVENDEIEAPVFVDASLPKVCGLIVFLRVERGMWRYSASNPIVCKMLS
jgi:hypothetical protein